MEIHARIKLFAAAVFLVLVICPLPEVGRVSGNKNLFPDGQLRPNRLSAESGPIRGAESRVLRISGSTTVLPIAQRGAEYFMGLKPDTRLSVSGTGSGEGLKALVEKAVDIATSSRDLKPREVQRMKEHGVELVRHTVAIDCLVVVVHPDNPVDNLSLEELKGLYDGRIKNWREVGGLDKKIIAINRDVSSGTFETWLEMVLQGERFRPDAQMQTSSGGVAYAVGGNRYAIGYIGLGYLSPKVKVVAVGGVKPSLATVRSGQYPLARKLFMFTLAEPRMGPSAAESRYGQHSSSGNRHQSSSDSPPPLALDFIDFLTSPDGRKLVEKEGFISVEAGDE